MEFICCCYTHGMRGIVGDTIVDICLYAMFVYFYVNLILQYLHSFLIYSLADHIPFALFFFLNIRMILLT